VDVADDAEVTVVRTGGVAGVRLEATATWRELDDDARTALLGALDGHGTTKPPGADRLTYEIVVREAGAERRCVTGEGSARHAAEAVLRSARRGQCS
jgi:hypothetical protein